MIKIDRKLIEAAENITGSNYEASGDIISTDGIELMIEELIDSFYQVVEKFEDYVKEVDENYRRINTDPYLEYGVNERDFV